MVEFPKPPSPTDQTLKRFNNSASHTSLRLKHFRELESDREGERDRRRHKKERRKREKHTQEGRWTLTGRGGGGETEKNKNLINSHGYKDKVDLTFSMSRPWFPH